MRLKAIAAAALAAALVPFLALAQAAPADPLDVPAPRNLAEAIVFAVLTLAVPLLLKLFQEWQQGKADRRLALVREAIHLSYGLVEEAKRMRPNEVTKTVSFALLQLDKILAAQGKPPTEDEKRIALATWGALHGQAKVQSELAAAHP